MRSRPWINHKIKYCNILGNILTACSSHFQVKKKMLKQSKTLHSSIYSRLNRNKLDLVSEEKRLNRSFLDIPSLQTFAYQKLWHINGSESFSNGTLRKEKMGERKSSIRSIYFLNTPKFVLIKCIFFYCKKKRMHLKSRWQVSI